MRELYIEAIKRFMESKQMKDYVCKDEEKGKALWNYSYENKNKNGPTVEMIKKYIVKAENKGEK